MLRFIEVSGTNYEIGFEIGKKTKREIKKVITGDINAFTKKKTYEQFFKITKEKFPQYVEELRGMANGADISFKKLFAYNLGIRGCGCTTLVIKKKKKILIGHNEDLTNNDIFLIRIRHKNKLKSLNISYYGLLPGIAVSINSKGFIQTINGLISKDRGIGFSQTLLCRAIIESKNIQEAVDIITQNKKKNGGNYIFYQNNNFVDIETTATKYAILSQTNPFIHTNHYLSKKLIPYEAKKISSLHNSISRLAQSKTLLKIYKRKSFRIFKKILSSHNDHPNTICRHEKYDKENYRTAGTILIDSLKKEMKIAYGNPCKSKFYTHKL